VGEFAIQNEAQNYPKHGAVYLTGMWRESLLSYAWRSDKRWTEGEAQPEGAKASIDTKLVYQSQPKPSYPPVGGGKG